MSRVVRGPALAGIAVALGLVAASASGQVAGEAQPRLWAVVIGVERYRAPIPPRPGLALDSRKLAGWLTGAAGWGADHVLVLNDDGAPRPGRPEERAVALLPTRANLAWGVEKWLGHRVRPGDVVLIAFAGRGASTPDAEVLLPIDAPADDPARGGWSPEASIERLLRDSKCSSVVTWIDAPMLGPGGAVGEGRAAGDRLLNRLVRWPGSSAWLATGEPRAGGGRGSPLADALRAALGSNPRSLLATLAALDADERLKGLGFRQRGGFPAELSLFRSRMQAPGAGTASLLVQKGHADRIMSLALGADGRTLISASRDSTIRIWRPTDRGPSLLRVLAQSLDGVTATALDPGGQFLAAGDGMGNVLVWDLTAPDARPNAPDGAQPHVGGIAAMAFLPDDDRPAEAGAGPAPKRLVSLDQNGRCELWDVTPGRLRRVSGNAPGGVARRLAAASRAGGPASLVVAGENGRLRVYQGAAQEAGKSLPGPGGMTTALHLSSSGRWAAVGNRDGRVLVIDLEAGKTVYDGEGFGGRIGALRIGPDGLLAVGTDEALHLVPWDHPDRAVRPAGIEGEVASIEFSADGRWLGACTKPGDLRLWKLAAGHAPEPVDLGGVESTGRASCLAFGPPSGPPLLVAGEGDGGLRRWDLAALKELPRMAPHRGRVRRLGVSPGGRYLLQISDDEVAQLWDLREGREVRTLAGTWAAGTFLTDDRLAMVRGAGEGGDLALVDRKAGLLVPDVAFARAPAPGRAQVSVAADFDLVAASRDGRRVAVATRAGRTEAVSVWDVAGGRPLVLAGGGTVTALDFSPDGRFLLTAGEDGVARLRDLADPRAGDAPAAAEVRAPQVEALTAARLSPDGSGRIVMAGTTRGGNEGVVVLADRKPGPDAGPAKLLTLGRFAGKVRAVAFSADGRYAAAAGQDRRMRIWRLAEGGGLAEVEVRPAPGSASPAVPHHTEQINELAAWPRAEGPTFVTGSDDTTIRFWRVEEPAGGAPKAIRAALLGTLTSAPEPAPASGEEAWVAFTPEGVYDGSRAGEALVSFVADREVRPLGQHVERLFLPLLTDQLRRGVRPQRTFTPPPRMLIEAPEEPAPGRRDVPLRVTLGDKALGREGLRLYQNDVPVKQGEDFRPASAPGEYLVDVSLAPGDNRFYAMAGRPGDVDARTPDLSIESLGAEVPGRLHVLALGVGKYKRNALLYADRDADDLSEFLRNRGVASGKAAGRKIVLTDGEVTEKRVETAFTELRAEVRGRPEDAVVVFLAGHTDLLTLPPGEPRFCLLLPDFPFPDTDPARAVRRGPGVAARVAGPPDGTFLPYTAIYRGLRRLEALHRLVIVDACQAEAILDDPGVRRIEQLRALDLETRRTRTDFFLASRRGEAAEEVDALKHGLLTYVLLRGMGASGLEPVPAGLVAFRDHPDADRDGDGTITTRELGRYVEAVMPELAEHLPGIGRGTGSASAPATARPGPPPPAAPPQLRAVGGSFPLIAAPSRAGAGGTPR